MRQFRLVHIGIAAALAAGTVVTVGLVRDVGAGGTGTASVFVPIVPCRLADTRASSEGVGIRRTPLGPAETVTFAVWDTNGNCIIPNTATGIAANATSVNPTASSFVTIYPSDAAKPVTSNLNFVANAAPSPNQVTVGLSATGAINAYNNSGNVDLIIDIVGYYEVATTGTGPQGPAGPLGPAGPACPTSGCVEQYSGLSTQAGNSLATSSLDSAFGCRAFTAGSSAELPLALPVGAKISAVSFSYIDNVAGPLQVSLWEITAPGSAEAISSNAFQSADSATPQNADLTLLPSPLPAVSATAVPYLFIIGGPTAGQKFCGATVTYNF